MHWSRRSFVVASVACVLAPPATAQRAPVTADAIYINARIWTGD